MDLPGPTDVMAFPMDSPTGRLERLDRRRRPATDASPGAAMLGDVVLCPAVAADQAARPGTRPRPSCTCSARTASCTCSATTTASRTRSGRCSSCRRGCSPSGRARPSAAPIRAPLPGTGGEVRDWARRGCDDDEHADDRRSLVVAPSASVPIGGLIACVDSALARVSRRASRRSCARSGRAPRRCSAIIADRAALHQPAAAAAGDLRADRDGAGRDRRARPVRRRLAGARCSPSLVMIVVCYAVDRRRARARSAASTSTGSRSPARRRVRVARPAVQSARVAADPARQRDHARPRVARRAVRVRGRAARTRRHGRAARRRRARRAADDPVGVRARQHDRPRGDGAAHRAWCGSSAARRSGRRWRWPCAAASRASRSSARTLDDIVGVVYLKDLARRAQDPERARTHARSTR